MDGGHSSEDGYGYEYQNAEVHHRAPRSPPQLHVTSDSIFTEFEPRSTLPHPPLINPDDSNEYNDSESDRETEYTYKSKSVSGYGGDVTEQLGALQIEDQGFSGLGIDLGTTDGKITPRSYADVVKTPNTSPSKPARNTNQATPKKDVRESAKPQGPAVVCDTPGHSQSLQDVVQDVVPNAVKLLKGRQATGTDRAEAGSQAGRTVDSHRPVTRGVTLDQKTTAPPTNHHKKAANRSDTHPVLVGRDIQYLDNSAAGLAAHHANGRLTQSAVSCQEPDELTSDDSPPSSWQLNTKLKGIGDWANESPNILPTNLSEPSKINLKSTEGVVQCAVGNSSSSGSKKEPARSSQSRGGGQAGPGSGKGGQRQGGNTGGSRNNGRDNGDGGNGNGKRGGPKSSKPEPAEPQNWYCCHFHKHDPLHFDKVTDAKYKSCSGKWDDISRLKEHIYRVHSDDINAEASDQLHKRPKQGLSNENRWYNIWDILFPDETHPLSPYPDSVGAPDSQGDVLEADPKEVEQQPANQELEAYNDFLDGRMPSDFGAGLFAKLKGILDAGVLELVINTAVKEEKIHRRRLQNSFPLNRILEPTRVSDNGAGMHPSSPLDFDRDVDILQQQPIAGADAMAGTGYPLTGACDFGEYFNSQLSDPPLQATPSHFQHSEGPATPARQSGSSKSARSNDSGFYSVQSGASGDPKCVNPSVFLDTPTPPIRHQKRNVMMPPGGNANISRSNSATWTYSQVAAGPPNRIATSSFPKPQPSSHNWMPVVLSDEDAPGSPDEEAVGSREDVDMN